MSVNIKHVLICHQRELEVGNNVVSFFEFLKNIQFLGYLIFKIKIPFFLVLWGKKSKTKNHMLVLVISKVLKFKKIHERTRKGLTILWTFIQFLKKCGYESYEPPQ